MYKHLYRAAQLCVAFIMTLTLSGCDLFTDKSTNQVNQFIKEQNINKTQQDWRNNLSVPPVLEFSQDKTYLWQLNTSKGDMVIELLPDVAPMHVSSTIYLTTLGFYDNTIFHRIIPGFMAQGGDPTGTGRGNPGYKYAGEFSDDLKHTQGGLLSMANSGPNTDGSQFFLTFTATPWLDGKHTIFGQVIQGMDVLESIEQLGSRNGNTSEVVSIITATILVQ
ncbi:MAG: peptidylprolyl isomerase [Paraglaciecola sp.]|mgnify:FL=1|jgi:peptidylprolyl isomerase|uniref:peptidylprolyl isomerase n=1 Tax=uncultured Paraglaciecola sp. TaxID=1765024 RepID=UPI0025EAF724|nr:peptidylprolyl isomerase [uncultured Paraglaciecola sp.]